MTLAAGWYGKIPSLGDFASRRLPAEFIETWDTWLQHSVAASRASLGDRWLDIYLTSPIWRFALMPEALGKSAWAGLLIPSVDKVGRHFPLTFALELAQPCRAECATLILSADFWFSTLETIALAALDVDFSADDLERELSQLPFPLKEDGEADVQSIDCLANWWLEPSSAPQSMQLAPDRSVLGVLTDTGQRILGTSATGKSIWWSTAGADATTQVEFFVGLPPEHSFARLLLGAERCDERPPA